MNLPAHSILPTSLNQDGGGTGGGNYPKPDDFRPGTGDSVPKN
jgi:hypothetical protein